jgi:hypothetical protein
MRLSLLALLLSLALGACATPRPPELANSVDGRYGQVRAALSARAEALNVLVEEVAPRVALAIPDCSKAPLDIRLVAKLAHDSWGGATYTAGGLRWIELPQDETLERLKPTLVHELVHYWLGPDWSALPGVLEEGLCDYIAHQIVPEAAALGRAEYAVMLSSALDGALRFDGPRVRGQGADAEFLDEIVSYTVSAPIAKNALPPFQRALEIEGQDLEPIRSQGVRGTLDALGYLLVHRIGVDALHKLCLRAQMQRLSQVPPEWIFAAARLDGTTKTGWRPAIFALFGEQEKLALLRREGLEFRDGR